MFLGAQRDEYVLTSGRSHVVFVQAARYMGCDDIHAQILEWLQKILREVAHHNKQADADNLLGASVRMQQACARIWHSTQVCITNSMSFSSADCVKNRFSCVYMTEQVRTGNVSAGAICHTVDISVYLYR